ncbi:MAG: uroporphyrinogen decarboxylase family protein [Armatimonadota bacterium]
METRIDRHLIIPGLEHIQAEPECERLINALLRKGIPERVPFMELIFDDEVIGQILRRPVTGFADVVEAHLRLGYDTISVRISPAFSRVYHKADNTAGLAQGQRDCAMSSSGLIRDRSDFERFPWPGVDASIIEMMELAENILPEGMGITLRSSGILDNLIKVMSYEGLCETLYDDPDLIKDISDVIGNLLVRTFEQVIDCEKVAGIFFGDDLGFRTSTLIAPKHLRTYIFPWLKRMVDAAHSRGKCVILHCCGYVESVMEDLISDVGIDAKHSFEDAIEPVTSFKARYGDRIGVVGGIDMDVLGRSSPEAVAVYTRKVLDECAPSGGYVLGTGNSVANYIPIENYFAMLREGWRFRR